LRRIVETDWRLFCTLIRFDAVYHGHLNATFGEFRLPQSRWYLRDLYQQRGLRDVNIDHINPLLHHPRRHQSSGSPSARLNLDGRMGGTVNEV